MSSTFMPGRYLGERNGKPVYGSRLANRSWRENRSSFTPPGPPAGGTEGAGSSRIGGSYVTKIVEDEANRPKSKRRKKIQQS